ncbi:guanine nucleotide-binding protein-like 3 homolog isoform X2 [Gordionus sp. m RMFG-2023]|uniref:guanine nucleotide-binding protein-like 3 homolog isoform X2 n=1 Tax=Gordionus sp. m RMFG-2023 TaxID=3053472 RepID=UPI0031FC6BA1
MKSFIKDKRKETFNIPNSFPFKNELLNHAIELKNQKLLEKKQKMKEKKLAKHSKHVNDYQGANTEKEIFVENINFKKCSTNFKNFRGILKQVIGEANVLLLVLDARDPMGTCCFDLKNVIPEFQRENKRLIILLNKIDLISRDLSDDWVKYLKTLAPTIPFKASTQTQNDRLGDNSCNPQLSSTFGRQRLVKLFANYCRNKDYKAGKNSLVIGVVGMPNVGKSSVINSLKRKKVCEFGSVPGITKCLKTVKIQSNISLIDTPGVVFNGDDQNSDANNDNDDDNNDAQSNSMFLKNILKFDQVDAIGCVDQILAKCDKKQLTMKYNIPNFENADEFLTELSKRLGKIGKGGVPDFESTAKHVLREWNQGKIKYSTPVPLIPKDEGILNNECAIIVQGWSKEFQIDKCDEDNDVGNEEINSMEDE